MSLNEILRLERVSRTYHMGEVEVQALKQASFTVREGEFVVVLGPSGSGKSTLLNIIGGMDQASGGEVWFQGQDITGYNDSQLTLYRRWQIGFVFQFYNLMPDLTALENVELATELSDKPLSAKEILGKVGLSGREHHFPAQMSGGEQQRVAIARAIAKNPSLLLCDEPTGALDFETGKLILRLLKDINTHMHKTILVITHNAAIADMADKVIRMRSGAIAELYQNEHPIEPERIEW